MYIFEANSITMKIKTLRADDIPMVVANNEFPKRLKKGGSVKKADGGVIAVEGEGDPLLKKTTPKPEVKVVPASAYNADVFAKELEALKGKKIDVAKSGDFSGKIALPKGELRTQVPALTTAVKTTQDYLYDYMKANKKDSLTAAEADSLLQKAKMGSYTDYINQAKNLKAYRDLTVVPAKALNQSVETGGTYNPVMGGGISMEPTIPFDSTHYEYTFPKNTYNPTQKKAKGGKIKGYQIGGNIQDESMVRGKTEKPLSTKPTDYLRDTGLGIIDWSLQGIGAQDVVKSEDYRTKQGKDTNRLNSGVGAVGSAIGGAVLDYFVPGLGTAVRGGKKGVGKMTGGDEGISEKDKETIAKVNSFGDIAGGISGMLGGNKKQANTEVVSAESTVDENGIDTTTGEIAVYDTAPTAQVTSGDQLTGQALNDWKSALTGEAKQSVLDKYNSGGYGLAKGGKISAKKAKEILHDGTVHGQPITDKQRRFFGAMSNKKADGGKIVGKGTGTSDSIPAALEDDGFVVPAVNAKVAEELRAKYLGDSKTKIASLKKGGVPVKVSNGEHYFTKEEKEILLSQGVDLDALAPNADVSATGKQDGGDIEAEANRKRAEKSYLLYVERQKAIKANPEKFSAKEIADTEANLRKAYETYKAMPKPQKKQSALEKMQSQVAKEQAVIDEKRAKRTPEETANLAGIPGAKKPLQKSGGIASVGASKLTPADEPQIIPAREVAIEQQQPQGVASIGSTITPVEEVTPVVVEDKKPNPFQRMDIGKGVAVAQTGLGLSQLLQDGKRPEDTLPADFVQSVDEAKAQANYGLSPLELRIAERGIDRNRAADEQTIINLSGGSAGTALANIRAASISANEAKGNLSAQSEALRLQKKRYADSLISQKADRSKQLFNEKLDAFNVDQQAGAALLGSGIRNMIGASRLDKELAAQKERENKYNPTFNV